MQKEGVRYRHRRYTDGLLLGKEAKGSYRGAGDPHGRPPAGEAALASPGRATREQGGHSEDRSD